MLEGKNIVVGVTGGIAAYKACELVSSLVKKKANVDVVMTKNAMEFVTPLSFRTLTKRPVAYDTFLEPENYEIKHISLAEKADLIIIAPATANIIGKIANGIADDLLSTLVMASTCPIFIAPAMNVHMIENKIVLENIEKLKRYGFKFIEPESGYLACGAYGKGRLCNNDEIIDAIENEIGFEKDLKGLNVLVSAGPTHEYIDPVRYITNPSSGKMGYNVARMARLRGAEVTLVSGKTNLKPPLGINIIQVKTADEMLTALNAHFERSDIVIMSAAVGDFKVKNISEHKIKKDHGLNIEFEINPDILLKLAKKDTAKKVIVGFSVETKDLIKNSQVKLKNKKLDMIVANDINLEGAGFELDTNIVSLLLKDQVKNFDKMSKFEVAGIVLDNALQILKGKSK